MESTPKTDSERISEARIQLVPGIVRELTWQTRDIRYGVKSRRDEYVYRGIKYGKHEFQPLDGSSSIYLLVSEIKDWT